MEVVTAMPWFGLVNLNFSFNFSRACMAVFLLDPIRITSFLILLMANFSRWLLLTVPLPTKTVPPVTPCFLAVFMTLLPTPAFTIMHINCRSTISDWPDILFHFLFSGFYFKNQTQYL